MKKFLTLMLVALVAVSALFVLVACDKGEPLEDTKNSYVLAGPYSGWKVNVDENDETKLDNKFLLTAITVKDKRVKSIRKQLTDAKYLYIIEHDFVNSGDVNEVTYALTEGADPTTFNQNMCVKVIRTVYTTVGEGEDAVSSWEQAWLPDAGNTTFKSLTPDTLYMPPHSEEEVYPNSGAWNDNPVVLNEGAHYIVFVEFNDGTFGLGAIAK